MEAGFFHIQGVDVETDAFLVQDGMEPGPEGAFANEVRTQHLSDIEIAHGDGAAETGGESFREQVFCLDLAREAAGAGGEAAVERQVIGGTGQRTVEEEGLSRGIACDGLARARGECIYDASDGSRREGEVPDPGVNVTLVQAGDALDPAAQAAGDAPFFPEFQVVDLHVIDRPGCACIGEMELQFRELDSGEGSQRPSVHIRVVDLGVEVYVF